MKTKEQKKEAIEEGRRKLASSGSAIFTDFSGTKVEAIRSLKKSLRESGAEFGVVKKRLLRLILQEKGIDLDPTKFESQVGTVFAKDDISSVAGTVYRFSQEAGNFQILGGLDLAKNQVFDAETVRAIGQLPSREVLLGQVLGVLTAPLRMFMYILQEKSKQS